MENSQQLMPLCNYSQQVYQVCINPKCIQVCFICDNKCQCKASHKQCDKVDWDYIRKKLNRDLINHTPAFKQFSDTLDQLYQNIIKDINKAYDDFKTWRDVFGLSECQLSFLHLIEEGRFTELTSVKMYEIRKQIRTPSKIILKSELKQEVQNINVYNEKLIEQLKRLYSQNKVIKEELKNQKYQDQNKVDNIKVENVQSKLNLTNKLLGLNENGIRFFTMINQGVIEKQLENILEKININEESINENKKVTNETINNIKDTLQLKIQKFTETVVTVAENVDSLKIEIKQNINDLQNDILQVNQIIKISNHITKAKFSAFDTKINLKSKIIKIQKQLKQIQAKSQDLKLFLEQVIFVELKDEFLKKFEVLKSKNLKLLNTQVKDDISATSMIEELTNIEKQALDIEQQLNIKISQIPAHIQSIKIQCISKFFTKKIKKLNLLYRASENNFQTIKFWDKCNGKTNTLTILKTQFDKIIGGYTPLAWNKSLNNYQQDTSKQTFLFSITQNHKVPISQNQGNAVCHGANYNYGPRFGDGADLYICDKANVTGSSYGNIGHTYNNGQYTYDTQQSYKKWCGQSNGQFFLIQQWQVYEITFE